MSNKEGTCVGPDQCKYIAPKESGVISKFFAQHWLPFVIYIFTFGTMVQQNRQSNAMVPQLSDRLASVEMAQSETAQVQKQTLELLKALNDEFRAYKDQDLTTNASLVEIAKRNRDDIVQLQTKMGLR